jgi:hypothetical protein
MNENFIDELIQEAEQKEEQQTEAYFDLLLLEIKRLNSEIENNFSEADKEVVLIKNWALAKNSKLQNRIDWLAMKLEAFIRERKEKTIELPNGVLKMHKKPDRVEITDLALFLKHARAEMLSVVPEEVKPDLNKIKAWIKGHVLPKGVTVIKGKEEFSYKLNGKEQLNNLEENNNGGTKKIRARTEQASGFRAAV